MKRKATFFLFTALAAIILLVAVFIINQLIAIAGIINAFSLSAGSIFLLFSSAIIVSALYSGFSFFSIPRKALLPADENAREMVAYIDDMIKRLPVHRQHPDQSKSKKDQRWLRTNLKLLDTDSLNITREIATKNFFVGAFAQNTSYGTTTSLFNNFKVMWSIYKLHHREQHLREFINLVRAVYESLPLADFRKEEIPDHIKPIIQSSFSNTLATLLPGGNLLTPFFLNLFLAGATNTYLTCLAGIIATRHCQIMTEEDQREVVRQSMFEASFMLKEIVKECNPVLSVTIINAVKKGGIESLDTIHSPSPGSGMAQDIVSHLASSLKNILKDNA